MKDQIHSLNKSGVEPGIGRHEAQLRTLLREARPASEPSIELGRRILDEAAHSSQGIQSHNRLQKIDPTQRAGTFRLLTGMALTGLLILALLSLPRLNRTLSSAAEVRQALAKVNTWHLRGWKVVDGKPVLWEVWGERRPFFYWEQVGGQITMDDGAKRLLVFPPDPSIFRKEGVVIKTPSRQEAVNVNWSYETMIRQWQGTIAPWKQTPTEAIFNFNEVNTHGYDTQLDKLYTVDKQTLLPKFFEARLHHRMQVQTIEYLHAEYNRPLPASLVASEWPQNYHVLDATRQARKDQVPEGNVITAEGLTVQMTPLAMDEQGDVLVRIRGWLGSVLMDGANSLMMQVSPPLSERGGTPAPYPYQDNYGRPYVLVPGIHTLGIGVVKGNAYHLVFAPAEPLRQGSPPPQSLTVTLSFGPGMAVKVSGEKNTFQQEWLFEKDLTFTIELPKETRVIDPRQYVSADFLKRVTALDRWESLPAEIAFWRANYYWSKGLNSQPENRADIARSAEWLEKAVAASTSGRVQSYRIDLAERYRRLGNKQRARQVLRDVFSEQRFLRPKSPAIPISEETWRQIVEGARQQAQIDRKAAEAALRRLEASP